MTYQISRGYYVERNNGMAQRRPKESVFRKVQTTVIKSGICKKKVYLKLNLYENENGNINFYNCVKKKSIYLKNKKPRSDSPNWWNIKEAERLKLIKNLIGKRKTISDNSDNLLLVWAGADGGTGIDQKTLFHIIYWQSLHKIPHSVFFYQFVAWAIIAFIVLIKYKLVWKFIDGE